MTRITKLVLALGIALTLTPPALAQYYWTGNGGNNSWSNPNNWLPAGLPPSSPATFLIFQAGGQTTSNQNLGPFNLNGLSWTSGSNVSQLTGGTLIFNSYLGSAPYILPSSNTTPLTINNDLILN